MFDLGSDDLKKVDSILSAWNEVFTGEAIRQILAEAGYAIVPKESAKLAVDKIDALTDELALERSTLC